jgi:LmbE family N-acetylglucosaminyl deacetylase
MSLLGLKRCAGFLVASVLTISAGAVCAPLPAEAAVSCAAGSTLTIVAHEDDDLLFLSPDIYRDIQAGLCERTVYVTAGDAGQGQAYWQSREAGVLAAYSTMTGVANSWTAEDAGISGHPAVLRTLTDKPTVSVVFMRLPDGGQDGSGNANNNYESLQKLYQGTISVIHAVDGSTSYTGNDLIASLTELMTVMQPQTIRAQDYLGVFGDDDHSDHHGVAYFVRAAHPAYGLTHTLVGYQGYGITSRPENVTGSDLTAKTNAWNAYVAYDAIPCGSPPNCAGTAYEGWLRRQYTVGWELGGAATGPNFAAGRPAFASSVEAAGSGPELANDGSGATRWSSSFADNQWWRVDLGSVQTIRTVEVAWEAAYASSYQIETSTDGTTFTTAATVTATAPGTQRTTFVARSARYVRIACTTRATTWGFSIWEVGVYEQGVPVASAGDRQAVMIGSPVTLDGTGSVDPSGSPLTFQWTQTAGPTVTLSSYTSAQPTFTAPGTATSLTFSLVVSNGNLASNPATVTIIVVTSLDNLAVGRPTSASSVEAAGYGPELANDGSGATRWSSSFADNQWWRVDLGSVQTIRTVEVAWEAAYASSYQIETSTDGTTFTTAATVTATAPGTQRTTFVARSARYVRIACTTRATTWGFSIWEVGVYA